MYTNLMELLVACINDNMDSLRAQMIIVKTILSWNKNSLSLP